MPTSIASAQDGARMTTQAFGGKKAAPFGSKAKRLRAKALVKKSRSVKLSNDDTDLAGKWRHGWVPLDPIAVLVKAKKYHGGPSGKSRVPSHSLPSGTGRTKQAIAKDRIKSVSVTSRSGRPGVKMSDGKGGHYTVGQTPDGKYAALHYPAGGGYTHLGRHDSAASAHAVVQAHKAASPHRAAAMDTHRSFRAGEAGDSTRIGGVHAPKKDSTIAARNANGSHTVIAQVSHESVYDPHAGRKARLSIRESNYRGVKGHTISGTDAQGRRPKVFTDKGRAHAEQIKANLLAGREPFAKADKAHEIGGHANASNFAKLGANLGAALKTGAVAEHQHRGEKLAQTRRLAKERRVAAILAHSQDGPAWTSGEGRKTGVEKMKAPSKDTAARQAARAALTERLRENAPHNILRGVQQKAKDFKPGETVTFYPEGGALRKGHVTSSSGSHVAIHSINPETGKGEHHVYAADHRGNLAPTPNLHNSEEDKRYIAAQLLSQSRGSSIGRDKTPTVSLKDHFAGLKRGSAPTTTGYAAEAQKAFTDKHNALVKRINSTSENVTAYGPSARALDQKNMAIGDRVATPAGSHTIVGLSFKGQVKIKHDSSGEITREHPSKLRFVARASERAAAATPR